MLLVAIVGVSLAAAAEVDSTLARREKEQSLLQIGQEFRSALARYAQGRGGVAPGQYPQRLEDLLEDRRYPNVVRHLRRVYVDPVTGKAEWGLVRRNGRIVGIHSLSAERPIKTDGFDVADARLRGARAYRDWVFGVADEAALAPPASASAPGAAGSAPQAVFGPVPFGPQTQR